MTQETQTGALYQPRGLGWGGRLGGRVKRGREWGQEQKGATEDEMAGWHHRLDGHEFE